MVRRIGLVALLGLVSMGLFASGGGETTAKATAASGPLGKYSPPLTIRTWRSISERTYVAGDTWDNNIWTRYFEDKLGIKFEYVWTCPDTDFNNKVNISIAAGDLPDMMPKLPYEAFASLGKAGRLYDFNPIITKYDMPFGGKVIQYNGGFFKESIEFADGLYRKLYEIGGKLYGFGDAPNPYDVKELWVRDDWRKAVNGPEPTSAQNFVDLAYKLALKDPDGNGTKDTWGFGIGQEFFGGGMPMEGMFEIYGSYPEMWVKEGAALVWGSVQDTCKEPLRVLQKMMKDGVIDPEWPVLGTWSEAPDQIVKEKVGMSWAQTWFGDWVIRDVMALHPYTATWTTYPLPSVAGGPTKHGVNISVADGIIAMNANAPNPEALMKLLVLRNMPREPAADGSDPYHTIIQPNGDRITTFFYVNDFLGNFGKPGYNETSQKLVTEALKTGDKSRLDAESVGYYDDSKSYLDKKDPKGYGRYATFGPTGGMAIANQIVENRRTLLNEYYAPATKSMNTYLGDLKTKRLEYFAKIISGELTVDDGFAQWLSYWNKNGGAEITKEVNDWYKAR